MEIKELIFEKLPINKIYICDTSDTYVRVSLIIRAGSNNDPDNKKGLAHFVEHICLAYKFYKEEDYIRNSSNSYIDPKNFTFTGSTDFDHTI